MPKSKVETSRPYNRSEKTIAKARKKLRAATSNASTNKVDGEKSSAKRGSRMGNSKPDKYGGYANDTSSMMRGYGARHDAETAAALKKAAAKKKAAAAAAKKKTAAKKKPAAKKK
jgi:hypothetical protein|tara:strand:- start:1 stop:345 length:345 start_codon:yes stop_codon:yes gene_type:complete